MGAPRYRAADPATLRWVQLDVLSACYHRASGQTHLLASPAPELMELLAEPLTREALAAALNAGFEIAAEDAGALDARLDELVAAGLVAVA